MKRRNHSDTVRLPIDWRPSRPVVDVMTPPTMSAAMVEESHAVTVPIPFVR